MAISESGISTVGAKRAAKGACGAVARANGTARGGIRAGEVVGKVVGICWDQAEGSIRAVGA